MCMPPVMFEHTSRQKRVLLSILIVTIYPSIKTLRKLLPTTKRSGPTQKGSALRERTIYGEPTELKGYRINWGYNEDEIQRQLDRTIVLANITAQIH